MMMKDYVLYNADCPAAGFTVKNGQVTDFRSLRPELLPMQLCDASADRFTMWLRDRAIDLNVIQHRNLVSELYATRDKLSLALMTRMFSLTDTFTCFEEGTFVPRAELCSPEGQDAVCRYILISSDTSLRGARIITPNVSTDGSFPKTWVYENGVWWLRKLQSAEASRGEVWISRALRAAGWDAAEYAFAGASRKQVKSRNFLNENEFFEPYESLRYRFEDMSDDDSAVMGNLSSLGEAFRIAWKRILLADAFFVNTDRHTRNFGVIRSSKDGRILRLAPNFDNNQAYKANPSGHYSDSMLRMYLQDADEADRRDLSALLKGADGIAYLAEACTGAEKYL